jgi:hypothetical protein
MSENKKIEIEVPKGAPSKPFFANSLLGSSKYFSTFSFAAAINLSNCAFSFAFSFSFSDTAFS